MQSIRAKAATAWNFALGELAQKEILYGHSHSNWLVRKMQNDFLMEMIKFCKYLFGTADRCSCSGSLRSDFLSRV